MVKIPIPDDWDGISWDCVRVQWPDSPKFWALLAGFLTELTRGRYWDENSGSIKAAQLIGLQIDERNLPFSPCNPISPIPEVDKEYLVQFFSTDCEDCMSACCANPKAFGIGEDGRLYVRDCCGDWVRVENIDVGVSDVPPVETIPDPPPTGYVNSTACAKARKLAELTFHIVEVAFDTLDGFGLLDVWDFWNDMQDAIPGVDLAMSNISNLWGYVAVLDLAGYSAEVLDERVVPYLKCAWAPLLTDDNAGITEEQYAELILATDAALATLFPTNSLTQLGKSARFAYLQAIAAIGAKDAEKITFYAQPQETDDCDCPDENPIVAGSIWFNGLKQDGTFNGGQLDLFSVLDSGRRVKWQVEFAPGTNKNFIDTAAMLSGATPGDNITIRMYPDPNSAHPGRVPANIHSLANTTNVPTDLQMDLEFIGAANPPERVDYPTYVEFTANVDEGETLQRVQVTQGFNYPDPSVGVEFYPYIWEITHVNGVYLGAIGP